MSGLRHQKVPERPEAFALVRIGDRIPLVNGIWAGVAILTLPIWLLLIVMVGLGIGLAASALMVKFSFGETTSTGNWVPETQTSIFSWNIPTD